MPSKYKRITTNVLQEMKENNEKISMLTSYDYTLAKIVDSSGIDVILVGDSASNVMAGHETTLPITLDHMIYHASSVVKAAKRSLVVVDLPFGSYQGDSKKALRSSIRIMKESGAHAVKLEGGSEIIESVERILTAGIPVMGHLGLTPQSIYKFGTYTVRAKLDAEAKKLISDAKLLQKAGCFSIVLEKIPAELAKKVAKELDIPIIGIGAGNPTKAICSTLIAESFKKANHPILPFEEKTRNRQLVRRHHSFCMPRDFDMSPFFEIIKPKPKKTF